MAEMREVNLPSGAVLKLAPAPFAQAKDLFQAITKELRDIPIEIKGEASELFKNLFTSGFSSKEIERCFWKCAERCLYCTEAGEVKVNPDTFEPNESRPDFIPVCIEVAKENIGPFVKPLLSEFNRLLEGQEGDTENPPSPPPTIPS
jgi:hypothetical protein